MTEATETKTVKTNAQKLEAAVALVAKLTAIIAAENALRDIQTGDVVTFKFGRKDKARDLTGVVTGTREDEKQGLQVAVLVGSGFDAQPFKVRADALISNDTAAERRAAEAAAEAGEHGADPLETNEG